MALLLLSTVLSDLSERRKSWEILLIASVILVAVWIPSCSWSIAEHIWESGCAIHPCKQIGAP